MKEKIIEWLKEKRPFAIYRKPNEITRFGWFQNNVNLNTTKVLEESCFVFAPFSGTEKVVFYPKDCQLMKEDSDFEVTFPEKDIQLENPQIDKTFHMQLVQKGIDAIQSETIEKVVLSRREEVVIDETLYEDYYQRFLKKYPTAFVYWFYHPKVGMWMGATPEQLVYIENKKVKTVALAGTQVDKGINLSEVVWGEKERKEQQIVTDFIVQSLKPFSKEIHQIQPFTHRAGSLLHIKTAIEAELSDSENAYKIVQALHPTPALCGFPKEEARYFILTNEGYDREYYGGFLGEWKFNNLDYANTSDLFVNLRCMKMEGTKGYLFLGGGVNKDSDPESEYYETVHKSKTVKSIL
ncbi:MAG TPA: isochorismate synthase [Flavobacterium sp.]|nr:isochorismate synthase [Flavobacterium sp.]